MPQFLSDTFTDPNGTLLTAHVSDSGHTWTLVRNANIATFNNGRLYTNPSGQAAYRSSASPATADYEVTATVRAVSALNPCGAGIIARCATANNFYGVQVYYNGTWFALFFKNQAGAFTFPGFTALPGVGPGSDIPLSLRVQGSSIRALANGIPMSTTDGSFPTGRAGVFLDPSTANAGAQLDSVAAYDLLSVSLSDAVALTDSIAKHPNLARGEALALADAVSNRPRMALAEALALADELKRGAGKQLAELLPLADAIRDALGLTLTDQLALADGIAREWDAGLGVGDVLALADDVARAVGLTAADVLELQDATSLRPVVFVSDALPLADGIAKAPHVKRTEALPLADAVREAMALALSEALPLTDAIARRWRGVRRFDEGLELADVIGQRAIRIHLADPLALADDFARSWNALMVLGDVLELVDELSPDVEHPFFNLTVDQPGEAHSGWAGEGARAGTRSAGAARSGWGSDAARSGWATDGNRSGWGVGLPE